MPSIVAIGAGIGGIPPLEQTSVPTGVPKTGYMIESMVTATAHNIRGELDRKQPSRKATWNALCLADFGDKGVAFPAMPQIHRATCSDHPKAGGYTGPRRPARSISCARSAGTAASPAMSATF